MTDTELCGETFTCEHCEKDFPLEQRVAHVDVYFCEGCTAEWRKEFETCEHDFEPYNAEGEDGQYCRNCHCFVADDVFPDLFGKPASSPAEETA